MIPMRHPNPRRGRRRALAVFALVLCSVLGTAAAPQTGPLATIAGLGAAPVAVADEGLTITSTNRYAVDEGAKVVHSHLQLTATNIKEDTATGYYYYPEVTIPLPSSSANVVATSDGKTLTVAREAIGSSSFDRAVITLPSWLRHGQSVTIVVDHDLVATAPRSDTPTRVGHGYASFPVVAPGNEGAARLEIQHAAGVTVDGGSIQFAKTDQADVVAATKNNYSGGIVGAVSLRLPSAFKTSGVTVGSAVFAVQPWPEDQGWKDSVTTGLQHGVPALTKIVGRSWPGRTTTVREDAVVTLYGFDGWYGQSDSEIVLGERVEPHLIHHELAHVWFNSTTLSQRWIREGLAEYAADRADTAIGATPKPAPTVTPSSTGALRLDTWKEPAKDGVSPPEDEYAYAASRAAITEALAGLSPDQVTAFLSDLLSGRAPYAQFRKLSTPADTHRFLDLLEADKPNAAAVASLKKWVLSQADIDALPAREKAHTAYRQFDALDGDWSTNAVDKQMSAWKFDAATDAMTRWTNAARAAGQIQTLAREAKAVVPSQLRSAYEVGGSSGTPTDAVAAAVPVFSNLAAAHRDTEGPVRAVGGFLLRVNTDRNKALALVGRMDLPGAASAASAAASRARFALGIGIVSLLFLCLAIGGLVFLGVWGVRRVLTGGKTRPPAGPALPVGTGAVAGQPPVALPTHPAVVPALPGSAAPPAPSLVPGVPPPPAWPWPAPGSPPDVGGGPSNPAGAGGIPPTPAGSSSESPQHPGVP